VLDPATAKMDPVAGMRMAAELGCKRIAVTVTFASIAKEIEYFVLD
jgi:hypothetical protein